MHIKHRSRKMGYRLTEAVCLVFAMILFFLSGICIVFTERIVEIFPYIVGSVISVLGFGAIVYGFHKKEYETRESHIISIGMISLILGIIILIQHEDAIILIGAIWGIKGLSVSVYNLNLVLYHMHRKEKSTVELIELLIEFPLAVLLLLDPIGHLPHHIQVLGLEQLGTGLQMIKIYIQSRKHNRLPSGSDN